MRMSLNVQEARENGMSESTNAVEVKSPEILKLVDQNASVEQLCTGFWFTEGPMKILRNSACTSAICLAMCAAAGALRTA